MPNPIHRDRRQMLLDNLSRNEAAHGVLPGMADTAWRETLVAQLISSLRRIEFIRSLLTKDTRRNDATYRMTLRKKVPMDAMVLPNT